jgi:hypothetical protein
LLCISKIWLFTPFYFNSLWANQYIIWISIIVDFLCIKNINKGSKVIQRSIYIVTWYLSKKQKIILIDINKAIFLIIEWLNIWATCIRLDLWYFDNASRCISYHKYFYHYIRQTTKNRFAIILFFIHIYFHVWSKYIS